MSSTLQFILQETSNIGQRFNCFTSKRRMKQLIPTQWFNFYVFLYFFMIYPLSSMYFYGWQKYCDQKPSAMPWVDVFLTSLSFNNKLYDLTRKKKERSHPPCSVMYVCECCPGWLCGQYLQGLILRSKWLCNVNVMDGVMTANFYSFFQHTLIWLLTTADTNFFI